MPLDTYLNRRDGNNELYNQTRIERLKSRQKEVLRQIKESQVPVEVCPTSNLVAHLGGNSYSDHPIDRLIEISIPFVICTDDYGIFGRSLQEEASGLSEAKGLHKDRLIKTAEEYLLGR